MALDQNPVFRKVIVPWYDAEAACLFVIMTMFVTFLFGIAGISVARETGEFNDYIWIALLITLLSCGVIITTTIRLIRRYIDRYVK